MCHTPEEAFQTTCNLQVNLNNDTDSVGVQNFTSRLQVVFTRACCSISIQVCVFQYSLSFFMYSWYHVLARPLTVAAQRTVPAWSIDTSTLVEHILCNHCSNHCWQGLSSWCKCCIYRDSWLIRDVINLSPERENAPLPLIHRAQQWHCFAFHIHIPSLGSMFQLLFLHFTLKVIPALLSKPLCKDSFWQGFREKYVNFC